MDEEFEEAAAAAPSAALPFARAGPMEQPGQHPLPEYTRGRKENDDKAGKWAGARYKQNTAMAYPSGSKLDICEDDDFVSDDKSASQSQLSSQQHTAQEQQQQRREKQLVPLVQQQLSHGIAAGAPLQHRAEQSSCSSLGAAAPGPVHQSKPAAAVSSSKHAVPSAAAGSTEGAHGKQGAGPSSSNFVPHGYDSQLLVAPDGKEQCFEEVRAAAWRARQQCKQKDHQQQQQQMSSRDQLASAVPASVASSRTSSSSNSQQQRPCSSAQAPAEQCSTREHSCPAPPTSQRFSAHGAIAAAAEPTVTINTRKALEAMNYMFSDDLPTTYLGTQAQPSSDPTMTMSTRAALDAMNSMFSEDLPTSRLPGTTRRAAPPAAHRSGSDPTVTISTRAALNALNGMFCDDLPTGTVDVRVAAAACTEPTMTFHSRAALDMVNGMFNDATTQPLRGHRGVTGRVSRTATGHIGATRPAYTCNAGLIIAGECKAMEMLVSFVLFLCTCIWCCHRPALVFTRVARGWTVCKLDVYKPSFAV